MPNAVHKLVGRNHHPRSGTCPHTQPTCSLPGRCPTSSYILNTSPLCSQEKFLVIFWFKFSLKPIWYMTTPPITPMTVITLAFDLPSVHEGGTRGLWGTDLGRSCANTLPPSVISARDFGNPAETRVATSDGQNTFGLGDKQRWAQGQLCSEFRIVYYGRGTILAW